MTEKRFNCHVKFSKMPNGFMVLDYTKNGKEQTVIEDISKEKAHSVMDRLNELSDENEQLKNRLKQTNHEINHYTCTIKQLQDKIDVKEALLKQYEEEYDGLKRTINIQKELFKKYGEDNVSFELLDDAMESYLND